MTTIHQLLEKYFDGETSASEEQQLRQYFRSQEIADDLRPYQSLFAYIDEEAKRHETSASQTDNRNRFSIKRKVLYFVSAAAASIAILLSINLFNRQSQPLDVSSGTFAVVNGRYYTDVQFAKSMALEALRNVFVPVEEHFPDRNFFEQTDVMRDQLRELSILFTE